MNEGWEAEINAYAKINLTLDVLKDKRPDGYHDIFSVMQSISLHDKLFFRQIEDECIRVNADAPGVPSGEENIVYRAIEALCEYIGIRIRRGIEVKIMKGIPAAAGLGGGSSDAAAVLAALNKFWDIGLNSEELVDIAKTLGADVPFCLFGGTAFAEGIGERITLLTPAPKMQFILVKPPFGVSTGEIYKKFDSSEKVEKRVNHTEFLKCLQKGDRDCIVKNIENVLEPVTASVYKEVGELLYKLRTLNGYGIEKVFMCGSGPTVCAVVENREAAFLLRQDLLETYPQTFAVQTFEKGSEVTLL